MIRKFFLLIGLLMVIIKSNAFEITKEETICTSSDGRPVTCGFLTGADAKKKLEEMRRLKKNTSEIINNDGEVGTCVKDKMGKLMSYILIDSSHSYSITNHWGRVMDFELVYNLHSMYAESFHRFYITLQPNERHDETGYLYVNIQPDKTGSSRLTSYTQNSKYGTKADDSACLSVTK